MIKDFESLFLKFNNKDVISPIKIQKEERQTCLKQEEEVFCLNTQNMRAIKKNQK